MIKNIIKNVLPPFIYSIIRRVGKTKVYKPKWNSLDYQPMQDFQIFFDPSGPWQKKMINGTYDSYLFNKISKENLEGKVVFDIGSHIGFHSFYFAKLVGKMGSVHAFEPNGANVERIKMILEKNGDILKTVHVHQIAVSDKEGYEEFTLNNDIESGRSSGNFIDGSDTFWEKSVYTQKGFYKTKVKTLPIDMFKKGLSIDKHPEIIKIDVEGAEHLVLMGAKDTLIKYKPVLFIEIHSILNMYNVIKFLNSINYKIELLNSENNGPCFIQAKPQ